MWHTSEGSIINYNQNSVNLGSGTDDQAQS